MIFCYMPLCIIKEPKSYYLLSCITSSLSSSTLFVARLADNFIQTTEYAAADYDGND